MIRYRICQHLQNEDIIAVKMGWSWVAFFGQLFWALKSGLSPVVMKTLITLGLMMLGLYYALDYKVFHLWSNQPFIEASVYFYVVCACIFGQNGSQWLIDHYCKRADSLDMDRYEAMKIISAEDEQTAIAHYQQTPGTGSRIRNSRVRYQRKRSDAGLKV